VFGWDGLGVISFVCLFFFSLVVVVYLSICFQFNRKLPFEKYSAALFCRLLDKSYPEIDGNFLINIHHI
jgi:hypothetical protein